VIRAYMPPMPLQEFQSARTLSFEPYEFSSTSWDNRAFFSTSEDNALLRDDFKFYALEGATYDIWSSSYFDPYILRLYDENGNFLAGDEGFGPYGRDYIQNYQAAYTGFHYVSASWNQGSYNKYVALIVWEDVDTIPVQSGTRFGTSGDDYLLGTSGPDTIEGLGGNDSIVGSGGNDLIFGQVGNDSLFGDNGDDELQGGDGDDTLFGGNGGDILFGQFGNDFLYGLDGDDELQGGDGDDFLDGNDGNDRLFGDNGNDDFVYSMGNDRLYGGVGIDNAYIGASTSGTKLTIQKTGALNVEYRNDPWGRDTLINIEKLTFTDRTLDLDNFSSLTQLNDAQFSDLAKVYVAYYNRAADAEGLYFWADKLAEGMDMPTIASYFSQSAEAKALYPNTADTSAFVTAVYANVLGRTPDQAGFDFWTTNLNNGSMQPATFVLSIIGGAQGADITYLSNKADLGVYFAAIKGMSDVADAQNVLNIFGDQATSNRAGAKASVDGHYSDATASGGGEFIFELVGIVNDPFAGVI